MENQPKQLPPRECHVWKNNPPAWFAEMGKHRKAVVVTGSVIFAVGAVVAGGIAIHHERTKQKPEKGKTEG